MLSTFTNDAAATGMNALMIAAAIFALILTVLWILVPFAVFGIKSLLRQLIAEQRRTNDLLTTPPVAPAATTVRTDVPGRVVVSEYVDIARAFFDADVAGMVNAVLDTLARKQRPAEFSVGASDVDG